MKPRLIPCIFNAALLLSGHVLASDLKWEVYGGLGAQHESNPRKTESGSDADTKVVALAGIRLNQKTEFIFLDFDYRASHETWLDDTFGDRNKLEGFGKFTWQPADFFSFYATNRREDLIVNNRFADTQNNRSVRSVLEVGALFTARLGRVDSLNLAPVYRRVNYSDSGIDSTRPGLLLFWGHKLSPTDDLTVNLFAERIDFESVAVQNDIDRAQAFLGYSARLNRLSYDLEGGYTWVDVDDSDNAGSIDESDNDYSGPLIRARANYQHENHRFTLRAAQDLTDTSIGLGGSYGGGYSTGDTNISQLALVTRYQVDVGYDLTFAAEQWNWRIGYRYDQQDVEATPFDTIDPDPEDPDIPIDPDFPIDLDQLGAQDEKRDRIYTGLNYQMKRNISALLGGSYQRTDFTEDPSGRVDDLYRVGLVFTFNIFKYGNLNLGAENERRNSNVIGDYVDNKVFASLSLVFPAPPPGSNNARGGQGIGGIGGGFGF